MCFLNGIESVVSCMLRFFDFINFFCGVWVGLLVIIDYWTITVTVIMSWIILVLTHLLFIGGLVFRLLYTRKLSKTHKFLVFIQDKWHCLTLTKSDVINQYNILTRLHPIKLTTKS